MLFSLGRFPLGLFNPATKPHNSENSFGRFPPNCAKKTTRTTKPNGSAAKRNFEKERTVSQANHANTEAIISSRKKVMRQSSLSLRSSCWSCVGDAEFGAAPAGRPVVRRRGCSVPLSLLKGIGRKR